MILNDLSIKRWAANGGVTPYDESLVNPASLDLRLGNTIREPHKTWSCISTIDMLAKIADGTIHDIPLWGDAFEFEEYWLMPKGHGPNFILCHSLEFVNIPDDMAAVLYSKSSTGRRGVEHLHAGYGDPGWHDAQWTWEIHNVSPWPIQLIAGKPLMQMVMVRMTDKPLRNYAETGRYNNQIGPTTERPVKEKS